MKRTSEHAIFLGKHFCCGGNLIIYGYVFQGPFSQAVITPANSAFIFLLMKKTVWKMFLELFFFFLITYFSLEDISLWPHVLLYSHWNQAQERQYFFLLTFTICKV